MTFPENEPSSSAAIKRIGMLSLIPKNCTRYFIHYGGRRCWLWRWTGKSRTSGRSDRWARRRRRFRASTQLPRPIGYTPYQLSSARRRAIAPQWVILCLLYKQRLTYLAWIDPLAGFLFEDFALGALAVENGIHVEHLGVVELQVAEERSHEE